MNRDVSESQLMDCEEYRRMMEYRKSHEKAREMHLNRERKFWELSDTKDLPILVVMTIDFNSNSVTKGIEI